MTWKKADRFRQRKSWNASLTICSVDYLLGRTDNPAVNR